MFEDNLEILDEGIRFLKKDTIDRLELLTAKKYLKFNGSIEKLTKLIFLDFAKLTKELNISAIEYSLSETKHYYTLNYNIGSFKKTKAEVGLNILSSLALVGISITAGALSAGTGLVAIGAAAAAVGKGSLGLMGARGLWNILGNMKHSTISFVYYKKDKYLLPNTNKLKDGKILSKGKVNKFRIINLLEKFANNNKKLLQSSKDSSTIDAALFGVLSSELFEMGANSYSILSTIKNDMVNISFKFSKKKGMVETFLKQGDVKSDAIGSIIYNRKTKQLNWIL